MLLNINEVILGLLCTWGGDRLVVPSLTRVDILVQAREGVNKKTEYITVPFQDAGEELLPALQGELHLWLPCKLLEVSTPGQTHL